MYNVTYATQRNATQRNATQRNATQRNATQRLRNRKHLWNYFHTVIETRVEVWGNEELQWEHEPVGRVFPRNFDFSQTSTSVSIMYGHTRENVFYFFYKTTRIEN